MSDHSSCSCWRCWFQQNLTPIVLFLFVLLGFLSTVGLMHEEKIDDKYVTWLEGFTMGAMTSLAVALKNSGSIAPHEPKAPTEKEK